MTGPESSRSGIADRDVKRDGGSTDNNTTK